MNNFITQLEPKQLKDLGIDYEYLDYYFAEVNFTSTRSCTSESIQNQIKGKVSVISQYLILSFLNSQSEEKIYWITITQFDYSYIPIQQQQKESTEQTLKLQNQMEEEWEIILKFQSTLDFENFELCISQICAQTSPGIEQNYTLIKTIGKGTQATIDLYDKIESPFSSKKYAVKTYKLLNNKNKKSIQKLILNEIKFLRELSFCENIIKLVRVYKGIDQYQLVFEFAIDGTLRDYINEKKVISEVEIRYIMEQLLLTIDLFHKQNIIHRDIKPDNILIMNKEELNLCVGDLGFACKANDYEYTSLKCGTPGYVDPEVLKGFPFTKKSDIFSLGSLLYNLITGKQLFPGRNQQIVMTKNHTIDPSPMIKLHCSHVSQECRDLLLKMINRNSKLRPTAEECLKHQWFSVNSQLINNYLTVNFQASVFNMNQLSSCFQGSINQFIMGAKFFQNIQYNSDNAGKFQMFTNTPMCRNSSNSPSPQFKVRYNHKQSGCVTMKMSNSVNKEQEDFSICLHRMTPFHQKKSTMLSKNIEFNKNDDYQQHEFSDGDAKLSFIEEYDYEDEIEIKVNARLSINDILNKDKQLAFKNKRRASLF